MGDRTEKGGEQREWPRIDRERLADAQRLMAEHRLSAWQALMAFGVPKEEIAMYEAEMDRAEGPR